MKFTRATKKAAKARLAIIGPAGSGKTYTALRIGCALGERVALIDTERGSASKYAGLFNFDVLELSSFDPRAYIEAIQVASAAGYDVLIIDSLSHAWSGKGGALELVDQAAKRTQSKDSFAAWREVTPLHNALVDAMIGAPLHVIATLRTKTDYVRETDEKGKTVIRKVGLAPIQRDGLEYEFDIVADLDGDNTFIVSKTRCPALSGMVIRRAGEDVATILAEWLSDATTDASTVAPANGNGAYPQQQPTRRDLLKSEYAALQDAAIGLGQQLPDLQFGLTDAGIEGWIKRARQRLAEWQRQTETEAAQPAMSF